ncbi:MAG: SMI1/KNR4 family protein [Faecalibacterium sp.]
MIGVNAILDVLRNAPDFIGGKGCGNVAISGAEQALGIRFAPDYRAYLQKIGLACFDGHELTGICKAFRLNVVDVTLDERKQCPDAAGWYVVEQANVDGIVIWQAPSGEIYQTMPGVSARKIYNSLTEYVTEDF